MIEVSRVLRSLLAVALVGLAAAVPASAHPEVPTDDPAYVAERLHHMGFTEWRKLNWSHGFWKVDDAKRENGHAYDLKIEAGTFDLVRLSRD